MPKIPDGLKLISFLMIAVLVTSTCHASVFYSGRDVAVDRDELVDDDIYILQNNAEILGRVNGDACVLAEDFLFSGDIEGNLNIAGRQLDVNGVINRTARVAGDNIIITGEVGNNLLIIGNEIKIRRQAKIGRDISCLGARISYGGECAGDAEIAGDVVIITGRIDGDLTITASDIRIEERAMITGNLIYKSQNEALIDDGAMILGDVDWEIPEIETDEIELFSEASLMFRFIMFLFILITGFVIILLFKRHARESSGQILKAPAMTFAVGILTMSVLGLGSVILTIFIVGIPVALMMLCLGAILFYIGKVYVAIALGRLIFMIFGKDKGPIGLEFLFGIIIVSLLFTISILGWIFYILFFIVGTGAAIMGYLSLNKKAGQEMADKFSTAKSN